MLSLLFLTLALGISSLSAQEPEVTCPEGSSSGKDVTTFTVSAPPSVLYPHIGDFYSPSWESILLRDDNFTFFPLNNTRTLTYYDTTTTETLVSNTSSSNFNNFSLVFELSSGTFVPSSRFSITYYQISIDVIPICSGGTMSSVTWNTTVCIDGDVDAGVTWFGGLHGAAARNVFAEIAEGWMGVDDSTCGSGDSNETDSTRGDDSADAPQTPNEGLRMGGGSVWLVMGAVLVGMFVV